MNFPINKERVSALLGKYGLEALLLRRVSNFVWVTCGVSSATNSAETFGSASLLITKDKCCLITSTTEEFRLS